MAEMTCPLALGAGGPGWQLPHWHSLPLVLLSLAICV